jgi:hypothetical protein
MTVICVVCKKFTDVSEVIAASIRLHGATSQTTVLFILAAMGS